jgi:hypothetical protein
MDSLLSRADDRRRTAHRILSELRLIERWSVYGKPMVVGAVAYGLVVAPDLDMEIYCDTLRIEDGFDILRACALHPRIHTARFANELAGPDQGLYWQLRYRLDDSQEWKVDMWSLPMAHPGPSSSALVEPMQRELTDETRRAILEIKEWLSGEPGMRCPSIYVYQAVLKDGIRTVEQFHQWREGNPTDGLTSWKPGGV